MATPVKEREAQLRARLAELTEKVLHIADTLVEPANKDDEERAVEREGDEVLESLGLLEKAEIEKINAALGRVADGTYGECVKCGEVVSEERLDLLPYTPFCRSCAP